MSHCAICLQRYNATNHFPVTLVPCGHTFCEGCIAKVKGEKKCATCRAIYRESVKSYAVLENAEKHSDYDALFKVFFVGAAAVGKTSLITRISEDKYEQLYIATIGNGLKLCDERRNGKVYRFQLWDSAGSEKFRAVTRHSYKNSDLVAIVYSVVETGTLREALTYWVDEVRAELGEEVPILLVGNKADQETDLIESETKKMCEELGCLHAWVSCKVGTGIANAWKLMVDSLLANIKPKHLPRSIPSKPAKKETKSGCCS